MDDVVEDSEPERERKRRRRDTMSELSRFAYKPTPPSSRKPADLGPPRPAAPARKDPPDYLSESRLSQLSKCVGCGLEWTSRKTAKQKRSHVRQCAKKNALTEDTIGILIEKELSPQNTASSRSEVTLMDSIAPTGPVKKSRRQRVLPTLRSLPETRDSILGRARDILGPTSNLTDPRPTQQFGQSALVHRNARHPERPTLLDANWPLEEPPSTQPFGASSLRGRTTVAERPAGGCEDSCPRLGPSLFAQDSSSDRLISRPHHKQKQPASSATLVSWDNISRSDTACVFGALT